MSGHLQFWITFLLLGHAYPIISTLFSTASSSTKNQTCENISFSSLSSFFTTASSCFSWNNVYQVHGFVSLPVELVYDYYLQLAVVSIIFTFFMSIYL
jgi:hypothetical protein